MKPKTHTCSTPYCRNTTSDGRKHCSTCRYKKWREANPIRYSYFNLKHSAGKRGKPFTISFDYFKKFCYRTDYIHKKGRGKEGYSVDCKINDLGYVPGNIALLKIPQNSHKGARPFKKLEYDYMLRTGRYVSYKNETIDGPF